MGVQLVGSGETADVRMTPLGPFGGISEVRARVPGFPEAEERLVCARLRCQKGGPEITGNDCLMCSRFRGWQDGPTPLEITIHCAWSHLAPVWARMTRLPALVTIPLGKSCGVADELARSSNVHHLVITAAGCLVGVVCRCDLRSHSSNEPVDSLLAQKVFAIRSNATLGEAVAALAELGIGCLPVVEDGALVGVITRGDLKRAGAPAELLGAHACPSCGNTHGVRCAQYGGGDFCVECRDPLDQFFDPREFGEGD